MDGRGVGWFMDYLQQSKIVIFHYLYICRLGKLMLSHLDLSKVHIGVPKGAKGGVYLLAFKLYNCGGLFQSFVYQWSSFDFCPSPMKKNSCRHPWTHGD